MRAGLVVGSVTTSEYPVLYVFDLFVKLSWSTYGRSWWGTLPLGLDEVNPRKSPRNKVSLR
ncbi:uncharacterized protein CLUP02_09099 [Colletotrichum lupini]|uniref:Uncharacterized protein n=1 Tax=Colletotrichum lupini TaxID=145971 RepID=A0A9Q8SV19_9PEZI|nr:uncharacterized protein CLUP02_09099 [Colletotrichum lupini]UQC83605.1 hypothetical protein CLUP02_09099 [Colletotrichum lupini]